jgi:hypothetical protein
MLMGFLATGGRVLVALAARCAGLFQEGKHSIPAWYGKYHVNEESSLG